MNRLLSNISGFFLLLLMAAMFLPVQVKAAEQQTALKTELIAVIPADFPPTYFQDQQGQPAGLAVDVMNAIARQAGLTITYQFAKPWQEIEDLVKNGKADLIPFRVMNDKTLKDFSFSTALDVSYINYIVREDDLRQSIPQATSRVGVIKGGTAHEYLVKLQHQHIHQYDSLEHLLIDLLSGQIDAILIVSLNLQQLAEELGLEDRIRVVKPAALEISRGIALNLGNNQLLERLDRAIESFHNSKDSALIYEKWLSKPKPYWTARRTAIALGSLVVAVAGCLIAWHIRVLRQTNKKLQNEQAFLQTMINAIPDFIFYKDRNSVYLGCNKAFAVQVHGSSQEQLVGHTDAELCNRPETVEFYRRTDFEVMEAGIACKFEVDVPLKNGGTLRAESIKTPFRNEAGEVIGVIGIARDITERFKHLQELEHARERAEAANRAKSQFLANMSHEIRTPLNGILGMAQLLAMSDLDQEQLEHLGMIRSSGENLLTILNDILDLAKIEAEMLKLVPKAFSPLELLNELISFFSHPCKNKGLELVLEQGQRLPDAIIGDPQRIKQILFNLLGNAVKFTHAGKISLGCSVAAGQENQVRLCFTVHDTGIGISQIDKERIFSPFEQVDNSNTREYGGTGLGLAICQRLTQLMGGSLELVSVVGQGSCFKLTLDFRLDTKSIPVKDMIQSGRLPASTTNQRTILIAEDNGINRFFMVRLLQQLGHTVLEAADGRQAMSQLQEHDCDLVLMDIQMPLMDGTETLKEIRQQDAVRQQHTPVIALTAYAMSGDREKFLSQGFDGYLAKPLQPGDLEAAVADFSQKKAFI